MIISFGDKDTELVWQGIRSKKFSLEIQNIARRKLRMINNAQNINDLRIPPANHLEKLSGNLKNYYSIRINKQFRIIFEWNNNNAEKVIITDYH
ncbi:MAG TPA: type II toxin-antitoxin system RelE/ParE family toxin [Chitinophagales bacterium]|jgi:proteic killer suppression protein|nr:type II toxin-antitoxin system RelE/ParE family toxin [Chitinophagales bacterium]HPH88330.1 type II toxin-antitoxin system RelE/ParE family toxin [Chitinophagales bacterium]HPN18792.1 type II toxin-antitoxin system RelE/ParE family toxin [Chitinophagales bacterium]